ncbi:hypothetical protein [Methanolapillus ohkumae]|uniref:Uncharacterized protein n=1 Tax=Methanolapillus ohkumae TaxID=3028298 RepID=A0AA96V6H8_9EURY|nr:hypothetical protein MsAm2_13810 [Methanosarcinaceae archaeon Am2]
MNAHQKRILLTAAVIGIVILSVYAGGCISLKNFTGPDPTHGDLNDTNNTDANNTNNTSNVTGNPAYNESNVNNTSDNITFQYTKFPFGGWVASIDQTLVYLYVDEYGNGFTTRNLQNTPPDETGVEYKFKDNETVIEVYDNSPLNNYPNSFDTTYLNFIGTAKFLDDGSMLITFLTGDTALYYPARFPTLQNAVPKTITVDGKTVTNLSDIRVTIDKTGKGKIVLNANTTDPALKPVVNGLEKTTFDLELIYTQDFYKFNGTCDETKVKDIALLDSPQKNYMTMKLTPVGMTLSDVTLTFDHYGTLVPS